MENQDVKNRILVVDDEVDMRELVCANIDFLGYDSVSVENVDLAFRTLQESHYDLIISDINMPKFTGIQFLEKLNQFGLDLPFIFLSAHSSSELTIQVLELGAFDCLGKPFDACDFRLIIREAMRVSKYRQKIPGFLTQLKIPSEYRKPLIAKNDIEQARIEIEKLKALDQVSDNSPHEILKKINEQSLSAEDLLRFKFAKGTIPQLEYLEFALMGLSQQEGCSWELAHGLRIMRGISSSARLIGEREIVVLANTVGQAFSVFRVQEPLLNGDILAALREACKVMNLALLSMISSFDDLKNKKNDKLEEQIAATTKNIKQVIDIKAG